MAYLDEIFFSGLHLEFEQQKDQFKGWNLFYLEGVQIFLFFHPEMFLLKDMSGLGCESTDQTIFFE